jgi:hypothetical protein
LTKAHTLAYLQLRSGRNVRGEIELALAQARDDSARLVLGAIRDALTPPSLDEVAARFRSGQPVPMALARAQLQRFGSWITPSRLETTPADPRVALPLLDRLMAYRLAVNASVWRRIEVRTRRDSTAQDPESFIGLAIKPGTFFKVDNLPRELVEKWGARARTITTRE